MITFYATVLLGRATCLDILHLSVEFSSPMISGSAHLDACRVAS